MYCSISSERVIFARLVVEDVLPVENGAFHLPDPVLGISQGAEGFAERLGVFAADFGVVADRSIFFFVLANTSDIVGAFHNLSGTQILILKHLGKIGNRISNPLLPVFLSLLISSVRYLESRFYAIFPHLRKKLTLFWSCGSKS